MDAAIAETIRRADVVMYWGCGLTVGDIVGSALFTGQAAPSRVIGVVLVLAAIFGLRRAEIATRPYVRGP